MCLDAASCKWKFISSIYILHIVVEKHNEHVVHEHHVYIYIYILKHRLHMQILPAPPTPTQKHIQIRISVKLKKYAPQTHVRTKSAHASEFYTSKTSSAKSMILDIIPSFQLVVWRVSPTSFPPQSSPCRWWHLKALHSNSSPTCRPGGNGILVAVVLLQYC